MSTKKQFIDTTFTHTAHGSVPHLALMTDHGVVRAPVKLTNKKRTGGDRLAYPAYNEKGLPIYMLPGGEELKDDRGHRAPIVSR